jgi:thiamine biosynthesis protein ThiS
MKITLNGKDKTLNNGTSLLELLNDLSLQPETVVIELNTEIIQPDAYDEQKLNEADSVEIIRFVGGG